MEATKVHYSSVSEIKLANRRAGQHFFDADTMRFFRSRVGDKVYGGRYFITSEQFDDEAPRLYTIREAMPNGHIEDASEFQAYRTRAQAQAAIYQRLI